MRTYTSGLINGEHVVTALMIAVHTQSGVIRYNTSDWDLTWGGFTWYAGDRLISVRQAAEDMSGQINGCEVIISSLDPATTSLALSETLEGNVGEIYLAIFNPVNFQIAEVQKEFSGRVSSLTLVKAGTQNG